MRRTRGKSSTHPSEMSSLFPFDLKPQKIPEPMKHTLKFFLKGPEEVRSQLNVHRSLDFTHIYKWRNLDSGVNVLQRRRGGGSRKGRTRQSEHSAVLSALSVSVPGCPNQSALGRVPLIDISIGLE